MDVSHGLLRLESMSHEVWPEDVGLLLKSISVWKPEGTRRQSQPVFLGTGVTHSPTEIISEHRVLELLAGGAAVMETGQEVQLMKLDMLMGGADNSPVSSSPR